jgi:tRNA threonylcarbamoyladenosine biosynthesis protein TsaB
MPAAPNAAQAALPLTMSDILLAIDTCTRRASIALRDRAVLRAEMTWECERQETALVSERVRELLASCHIAPAGVSAVAVAIGPGSFTGVRCGLAIAKGMAVALDIPIIGINAFDVIAYAQPPLKQPILAVLEAGRKRVAVCPYDPMGSQMLTGEWKIQTWQEVRDGIYEPTWVCGDLTPELLKMLEGNANARIAPAPLNLRRAGYLAEIGYRRWQKGEVDDAMTLTAIYPPEPV